jgi:hypothetical protein
MAKLQEEEIMNRNKQGPLIYMLHLSLEDKLTINNDTIKNVLTKIDKKQLTIIKLMTP